MQHSHRCQVQKEKMSVSPEETVDTHMNTHLCTYAHEHTHRHTCVHSCTDLTELIGSSDTQIQARSKLIQGLHTGSLCSTSVHTWLNLQTNMTDCILLLSAFCSWRNSSKILITLSSQSVALVTFTLGLLVVLPHVTPGLVLIWLCGTRSLGCCWLYFYSY